MISRSVLANAAAYCEDFQTAQPFKHVCIDDFFTEEWALLALRDFPPFDPEFARNEFGEYGGKAVISDIASISSFYAELYRYIMSPQFMASLSTITGIEGLHGDPALYGGGTHENLNGQELDCHVDFNFQISDGFHRRANLLLYLNREWDPGWGGAIELHSNPRRPEEDEIKEYNVNFNRAIIFETNEYSWHGFRRIQLPPDRLHLSRKCLSIYLYTKDRPADEIAGPHGTFYVQRPLSKRFVPGYTLSGEDINELRTGYDHRDRQVERYQGLEEKSGRELEEIRGYLREVLAATRAPLLGFAQQVGSSSGLYHDQWAGPEVSLRLRAERPISGLTIRGFIPAGFPMIDRAFEVEVDGNLFTFSLSGNSHFEFPCPVMIDHGAMFALTLRCDTVFNASAAGKGGDVRDLSYHLNALEFAE